MAATSSTSSSWQKKLQQQYVEGKFTDVTIRCTIVGDEEEQQQPPAKRSRTRGGASKSKAGTADGQSRVVDICCHGCILSARSQYFESALGGQYVEAQAKTIEIVLVNDQAVEDFKLLIKLNYGASYTNDGGVPVPKATRLRLLVLASAFAFEECIVEVLGSLGEDLGDLSLTEVISYLEEIPEEVRGHEAIGMVKVKVVKALSKRIEQLAKEERKEGKTDEEKEEAEQNKKQAGNALVRVLGEVYQLFEGGEWLKQAHDCGYFQSVPLKEHVLHLPPRVLEVLLQSEDLQYQTENEVYALICSWISQSHHAVKRDGGNEGEHALRLFRRLLRYVKCQKITEEYLGAVVSCCEFANKSGTLPYIIRSHIYSLGRRGNNDIGGGDWTFKTTISLDDLINLQRGQEVDRYLGIAAGFPVYLNIEHDSRGAFRMYLGVRMPTHRDYTRFDVEVKRYVRFGCKVCIGSKADEHDRDFSYGRLVLTALDMSRKPWGEVVHDGSSYFPGGKCPVVVTMELYDRAMYLYGEEEEEEKEEYK